MYSSAYVYGITPYSMCRNQLYLILFYLFMYWCVFSNSDYIASNEMIEMMIGELEGM
jgi:hypothetical protein